ncbi:cytochrome c maturation protein CcmE [Moraxella nasovis]|uniref:cytochrome c maturation protein CcmE n=1 Tax=Moraxella nasovis TaxID=2904121 RepID=UPI001F612A14|nr:cytochrome c maturation protein CcmE [Moraxella nasovis]UNU74002.1 cytochrome c maturation protein CcmE [Moraxella nasovis]
MNQARQKKLMWVIAMLVGAVIAVSLILYAVRQQTDYYFDPTAISQGQAPQAKRIRAGGMVVAGSVKRDPADQLNVQFAITDYKATVPVSYRGVLPDLFAENSGVVATGELKDGVFVASEVLAKHDENYMPPEVAKSLKTQHTQDGVNTNGEQFVPATSMAEIDERNTKTP